MNNILSEVYHSLAYFILAFLIGCESVLTAITLFFTTALYVSYVIRTYNLTIGLLYILVYLGALLILFAYLWMYITYASRLHWSFPIGLVTACCWSQHPLIINASVHCFIISSSLLLVLAALLFWGMIVVVFIVDLGMGCFSS